MKIVISGILFLCFLVSFSQPGARFTKTLNDTVFVTGDRILVPDVIFCDSATCPQTQPAIDQLVNFFERNPLVIAEVIVYTDCRGPRKYNQEMSLLRAKSLVAAIAESDSIIDSRLIPMGVGEDDPIYACDYVMNLSNTDSVEFYHRANQRVEVHITGILKKEFYENHGKANHPKGPIDYDNLVLIADKALLEQDYLKALEYYERAVAIAPSSDPYPAGQAKKIREMLGL